MAIPLQELCDTCNQWLEISLFSDYCPNGLQIEGKREVHRIATAVSASLHVIEQAVAWKADLLLVHHGLFWQRDPYPITGIKRKKIDLLLKHEISLLAYHLPLDAHKEWGNNWRAAKEMGWSHLEPFGVMNGAAIGVKGEIPPLPVETFRTRLETYYQHPAHTAPGGSPMIQSIALISGGAHREIHRAIEAGADAFVTGSFDEPIWHIAHEEKIHFFALGHSHTERIGPRAFGSFLAEHFNLATCFIDEPNPF